MAKEKRLTWKRSLDGHLDIGLREGVTVAEAICKLAHYEEAAAVEVVHGRWEWNKALFNPYALCSNCGCGLNETDALNFSYCPYCGAKMDGGKTDGQRINL